MSEMVNKVRISGFLRENNLNIAAHNGVGVIRGNVVVTVEETGFTPVDIRVDYYATAGTKAYDGLVKMLPTTAVSYSAIKSMYPTMSDAEIKAKATKVDVLGSLEENMFKGRDGSVVTAPRIKGFGLFAKEGDFVPYENITATAYVETIGEETDKDGAPTGRYVLNVCVPNCFTKRDGTAVKDGFKFKLVCVDPVAPYLATYCPVGSTLPFIARIVTHEKNTAPVATAAPVVGVNNNLAPTVSVVQEIEIIGVSVNPMDYTETNGYDPADVRDMLASRALRMEAIEKNDSVAPARNPAAPSLPTRATPVASSLGAGLAGNPTPAPAAPATTLNGMSDLVF